MVRASSFSRRKHKNLYPHLLKFYHTWYEPKHLTVEALPVLSDGRSENLVQPDGRKSQRSLDQVEGWVFLILLPHYQSGRTSPLGIAWEKTLLMANSAAPHCIPEDANATLRCYSEPFFHPNQLIILKESTNSHPFSCILSPPPHIVENYWTNQVHRSWATHWWYANAHLYLGHISNMPKEHKCITSRSKAFIPDATSQIEGLTVITSKEWIEGAEFNSWKLLCTIGDAAPQENFYDPKELVSFSRRHPKLIDVQMMESKKIFPYYVPKDGA